jgi:formylglycine-generating enzyme required for sulfatase activity
LQNKDYETQDDVLLPRYWRDARFGINRKHAPVVGVTWYEAGAYCKWLLQNWDELDEGRQGLPKPKLIRFPLETEWAFAAGGDENNRFAFGELKEAEKEIVNYANTSESGIGRTTPVWMYPQGKSAHDVMDMSGNVWEWQANYKDKDHDVLGLRGGSWDYDEVNARVSIRNDYYLPYGRLNDLGFRVVACSLPSGIS